ncbi:MAG: ABC transporter ATP-binding protein [Candidatus Bathyarchaeia archaeon]
MLLQVKGLSKAFGGLQAVDRLDFFVHEGEILGLIGPNGAGKTTVFNLISGYLKPDEGEVSFQGRNITGFPPHKIVELGISRTFQSNPLFEFFTVFQNVYAGFYLHPRSGFWEALVNSRSYREAEKSKRRTAWEILEFLGLRDMADVLAKDLPVGYRAMVAIGRAVATKPKLLLLDEPTAGMAPNEVILIKDLLFRLRSQGVTLMIVEHNMDMLDVCDRVMVMNFGRKIAEGSVQEIRNNKDVIEAYLGS